MGKRKYTIPAEVRGEITDQAEAVASALITEHGVDRASASDAVESVVSEVLEAVLEALGMPDPIAEGLSEHIVDALKPDRDRLLARATKALGLGKVRKAERLLARMRRGD